VRFEGVIWKSDLKVCFEGDLSVWFEGDLSVWFECVIWVCDLSVWFEGDLKVRFDGDLKVRFEGVIWTCDLNVWFERVIWTWFEFNFKVTFSWFAGDFFVIYAGHHLWFSRDLRWPMSTLEERIEARMRSGRGRSKTPGSPRRKRKSPSTEIAPAPILGWPERKPVVSPARPRRNKSRSRSTSSTRSASSPSLISSNRRTLKRSESYVKREKAKFTKPRVRMWKHGLVLMFLFALAGGLVAFVTPSPGSPSFDDPYQIFNLKKSDVLKLPIEERRRLLKRKYRMLSKEYHPDKPSGSDEKFILLIRSYEKLEKALGNDDDDYVPEEAQSGSSKDPFDEELERHLKEAEKLVKSLVSNKLLRCITIGALLGLVVGSMSKHIK
jgi:hypothetical protein